MDGTLGWIPTLPTMTSTILYPSQVAASEGAETGMMGPIATIASTASQPLFTGASGPPLVLAFLAVGLLLGALAALFVVRCMTPGYRARLQAEREALWWSQEAPPLGDPPKLWDVYVEPSQSSQKHAAVQGESWSRIAPISAYFIPDSHSDKVSSHSDDLPLPAMTIERQESTLRRFYDSLHQYYFPAPHHHFSSPSIPPTPKLPTADPTETHMDGQLQIAVAIAMPCRPLTTSVIGSKGMDEKGIVQEIIISNPDHIPEFCVGIAQTRSSW